MTKQSPEREAVLELLVERGETSDPERAHGTERVDIELRGSGNGPFVCTKRDWEWIVDEPPQRGGTDSGPNPLAYFISGAATCLLSHYMICAIAADVEIESLRLRARMRFHRALRGGRITEVIYDLAIATSAPGDALLEIAGQAEAACYAHNTLGAAGVKLTTNLEANGRPLASLAAGSASSRSA